MIPTLYALIGFILLILIFGILFFATAASLIVNGIILYLLGIRALKEANRGWWKEYGWGAVIAFAAMAYWGNPLGWLWDVTTFLIFWFVAAQVIHAFKKE
jgi:hypothetical protein